MAWVVLTQSRYKIKLGDDKGNKISLQPTDERERLLPPFRSLTTSFLCYLELVQHNGFTPAVWVMSISPAHRIPYCQESSIASLVLSAIQFNKFI